MNSETIDHLNQSTSSAEVPIAGVQTRSMSALAQPTPPAAAQPTAATQSHASTAEVILNDHISVLGMELAQAVINQNNSLVDSILVQIATARNALLALNGVSPPPPAALSPASSATYASATAFSIEKKVLSCMDKLPLWKTGHDPLLFLNDFSETCDGFSIDLADKQLRKRLFKFVFKKDPSLRAGVNHLIKKQDPPAEPKQERDTYRFLLSLPSTGYLYW